MLTIRQTETGWEIIDATGAVLSTASSADAAFEFVAAYVSDLTALAAVMPVTTAEDDGLLPEPWESVEGIIFAEPTGDGRDFTDCVFTARDPAVSTLPLMLQTCTAPAHYEAELAGFIETIDVTGTPSASGRFYACEAGEQARDLLLGDRTFGVSCDPGPATSTEFVCTETDEDGWCIDGVYNFLAYEIIGLTMLPFPGFARASIRLGAVPSTVAASVGETGPAVVTPPETVDVIDPRPALAAAGVATATREHVDLAHPPLAWFQDPALLMPTPLTITNDGHVLGHIAAWGTCHVGEDRLCLTPPSSNLAYERFLVGEVATDAGDRVPTGALTWGIPHADLDLNLIRAAAHYADSRHGWADVTAGEDDHGIWVAGAIRPGVTDDDLRILRALALSGDWRRDTRAGGLELIAALAVNVPGFPIPRAVTAAAGRVQIPTGELRARRDAELQVSLVASGIVRPERVQALAAAARPCGCADGDTPAFQEAMRTVAAQVAVIEQRTRHLLPTAIRAAAQDVAPPA